jgi:hypothetical protein
MEGCFMRLELFGTRVLVLGNARLKGNIISALSRGNVM